MSERMKSVTVSGHICTDKQGSECEFEFEMQVPGHLKGKDLEAHVYDEAREAAFEQMEWAFAVRNTRAGEKA